MTVAELQLLLSDLGKFLRASEATKVAGELEYISAKLVPFRGYKLKAFADFLEKAEAYSRGRLRRKRKAAERERVRPTQPPLSRLVSGHWNCTAGQLIQASPSSRSKLSLRN